MTERQLDFTVIKPIQAFSPVNMDSFVWIKPGTKLHWEKKSGFTGDEYVFSVDLDRPLENEFTYTFSESAVHKLVEQGFIEALTI